MTPWILAVLALWIGQTLLPGALRYLRPGPGLAASLRTALGPRDTPPPMPVLGARAARAQANLAEALPVFLGLALLLELRGAPGLATTGAAVFLGARVLYVPAYLSGVPGLRSAVWMVGHGGLGMLAWAAVAG